MTDHFQPELIKAAERGQIRTNEDSVRHVEVFQMRRVGTFILGRPRPLPRQRHANHPYTLICEEPVKLTPRMAAQLDSVRIDDLDAFGRVSVYRYVASAYGYGSGGYGFQDVLLGRDKHGDLAIADLPNPFRYPELRPAGDSPKPRLGAESPGMFGGSWMEPSKVMFEGRECFIYATSCEEVTDGSMAVDELDPNGNEEPFRGQIAEHDRTVALREELLDLPRILLQEN